MAFLTVAMPVLVVTGTDPRNLFNIRGTMAGIDGGVRGYEFPGYEGGYDYINIRGTMV